MFKQIFSLLALVATAQAFAPVSQTGTLLNRLFWAGFSKCINFIQKDAVTFDIFMNRTDEITHMSWDAIQ